MANKLGEIKSFADLVDYWIAHDTDKNGLITTEEAQEPISDIDGDGDNCISPSEVVSALGPNFMSQGEITDFLQYQQEPVIYPFVKYYTFQR